MNGARKRKDNILNGLIYGSAFVTVAMTFILILNVVLNKLTKKAVK